MATAIHEHVFTDTGDFTASGAWTTGGNWASASAPVTAETVIISTPAFDVNTFPDVGTVDLGALTISEKCTKQIGGSGDRMDVDALDTTTAAGVVTFSGKGAVNYFECDTNYFLVDHRSYLPGSLFVKHRSAGIGDVWINDGSVTLDGGTYTRIVSSSIGGNSSKCVIDAGSTLVTVIATSGIIECSATDTITTLELSGSGRFEHLAAEAITTINIYGGEFYFDGLATVTEINQWGGTVDASRTDGNKVITTYNGHAGRLVPPAGGGLSVPTKNFSSAFDRGGF